jgi:hypothetical protein
MVGMGQKEVSVGNEAYLLVSTYLSGEEEKVYRISKITRAVADVLKLDSGRNDGFKQ